MASATGAGRWNLLVTDGHVIAARLRWLQGWLIGGGLLALVLGAAVSVIFRPEMPDSGAPTIDASVLDLLRRPAVDAVKGLPAPRFNDATMKYLAKAEELGVVNRSILTELETSGSLPSDVPFQRRDPKAFWRTAWPYTTQPETSYPLAAVDQPDLKIVGTWVLADVDGVPQAYRWMGVYSRRNGHWRDASLDADGFISIEGRPRVRPSDIPLTLAPALPEGGFHG